MNIHIRADFSLSELQAFIDGQEAAEAPEGYYTAQEWADHFGVYIKKMRQLLRQAKAKGLLDMVYVYRESLDERRRKVPAYALRMKEEEVST